MESTRSIDFCDINRWVQLRSQLNNLSAMDFLEALCNSNDAVVIDVRTAEEFSQFGSLPSAINISYLLPDLWDHLENLDRSKSYFIYCRTGRRSVRVCTLMRNGGFPASHIFNLEGGIIGSGILELIM